MSNSIQARNIVRYARRNNITICRGGVGWKNQACAYSVLGHMLFGKFEGWDMQDIAPKMNKRTNKDILALEAGFEGYCWGQQEYGKNPYYKVGKNVARLAGLRDIL